MPKTIDASSLAIYWGPVSLPVYMWGLRFSMIPAGISMRLCYSKILAGNSMRCGHRKSIRVQLGVHWFFRIWIQCHFSPIWWWLCAISGRPSDLMITLWGAAEARWTNILALELIEINKSKIRLNEMIADKHLNFRIRDSSETVVIGIKWFSVYECVETNRVASICHLHKCIRTKWRSTKVRDNILSSVVWRETSLTFRSILGPDSCSTFYYTDDDEIQLMYRWCWSQTSRASHFTSKLYTSMQTCNAGKSRVEQMTSYFCIVNIIVLLFGRGLRALPHKMLSNRKRQCARCTHWIVPRQAWNDDIHLWWCENTFPLSNNAISF